MEIFVCRNELGRDGHTVGGDVKSLVAPGTDLFQLFREGASFVDLSAVVDGPCVVAQTLDEPLHIVAFFAAVLENAVYAAVLPCFFEEFADLGIVESFDHVVHLIGIVDLIS